MLLTFSPCTLIKIYVTRMTTCNIFYFVGILPFRLQNHVKEFPSITNANISFAKYVPSYPFVLSSIIGWSGDTCDVELESPCLSEPCEHNGTCVEDKKLFHCGCPVGWTGSHCEVNINECASNPCVHGVCVDREGGYQCFCVPGRLHMP